MASCSLKSGSAIVRDEGTVTFARCGAKPGTEMNKRCHPCPSGRTRKRPVRSIAALTRLFGDVISVTLPWVTGAPSGFKTRPVMPGSAAAGRCARGAGTIDSSRRTVNRARLGNNSASIMHFAN